MRDTTRDYDGGRSDAIEQLMTIEETASALAVSRATVYRLLGDGVLPPIRVRSHIRIAESDLRDLIERRRAEAARAALEVTREGSS